MKSSQLQIAQWLIASLLLLVTVSGFSQRAITWKGGTPGMKNDWFCPQNWSTTSIPDEFSDVIIPDVSTSTFAPPAIRHGRVEINSLNMYSNASLTIAEDVVVIVISSVVGLTPGKLKGEGLLIHEEETAPTEIFPAMTSILPNRYH